MMNKSLALVPAAVLLALSGAASAQTSVTMYGIVSTQITHVGGTTSTNRLDNNNITPSRLGFKGTEDLGGGNTAFFGIESGFDSTSGANSGGTTMWNRGSFVGLGSSTLGKVSLGRQWNLNDDFMCGLYVCGGYAAFYNPFGAYFGNSSNLINGAVKYTLPSIAGFNGGLMYAAKPNTGSGRYASGVLTYSMGPVTVGASYDVQANAAGVNDKLAIVAGKVAIGSGFVRAAYTKANAAATQPLLPKAKAFDVGGGLTVTPATTVTLDYVAMDVENSADDGNFIRARVDYALSKRTTLNGNLVRLKNKGAGTLALAGGTVAAGGSQTVYSVGVVHAF